MTNSSLTRKFISAVLAFMLVFFNGVPAFAEHITVDGHQYELDDTTKQEWTGGTIPYGYTVMKNADGAWYQYKLVGDNWGLVGRGETGTSAGLKYYKWDIDNKRLEELKSSEGHDIAIKYNSGKAATDQITKYNGETCFVGLSSSGGGVLHLVMTSTGTITADFVGNTTPYGMIYSYKNKIVEIKGDFIGNSATKYGGAIHNTDESEIGTIKGDFIGNSATDDDLSMAGAICNKVNSKINAIYGDFIGNSANNGGGAISNNNDKNNKGSVIGTVTGDFIGNSAYSTNTNKRAYGGAIFNSATMTILAGDRDITFCGNTVVAKVPDSVVCGGAIYNFQETDTGVKGILNLNASAGKSITFIGSKDDTTTDSVHNISTMNINNGGYTGTVSFKDITDDATPLGTMNIAGGTAEVRGSVTQNTVTVSDSATLKYSGANDAFKVDNFNLNGTFSLNDLEDSVRTSYRTLVINPATSSGVTPAFTLGPNATFVIQTDLESGKGDSFDLTNCTVTGTRAYVQVSYDKGYLTGTNIKGVHTFLTVDTTKSALTDVKGVAQKYTVDGKIYRYTPTVTYDDAKGEWKITALTVVTGEGETTKAISDSAINVNTAWLENVNNLQKRMGELRAEADAKIEARDMAWARFQRSNDDVKNGRSKGISGNLYQVGYDFLVNSDNASRSYFGLSLDVFDGTQSFKIGGGDISSTTFSAYFTKIYGSGSYFDIIARYGRYDSEISIYDADIFTTTKLDYGENAFTLSGEYGYRWKLSKSGLYLEPQAEVIYGYLSGAKATSNQNIEADIDSTNHLVTRVGLALGQKVQNFNYYLRASYYHDFAGSTNVRYDDESYKQDGAKNWWEVSLGGGWRLGKACYFYFELSKYFHDISNSVNFNLGFRFTM